MLDKIRSNKWIGLCILILELMIIGGAVLVLSKQPSIELNFTQDDLVYDSGEPGFYVDTSFDSKYVSTPDLVLPKGFYTLEANCEYKGYAKLEVVHSDGLMNSVVSDNALDYTNSSSVDSCDFRVRYADRNIQVRGRLTGDAAEGSYILVRSIRIVSSPLTMRHCLFWVVVLFLVIDTLLLWICYKNRISISEQTKTNIRILILLIAIVSIPLMVNYLPNEAHDKEFHLTRIEGIKEGLLNGNFPLRIESSALHGHGYPYSIFYGDILLYIPAVLRIFGISISAAYNFYVLLINVGTVLISYYCFSKMSNTKTGMICTAVFSLNIYRLFDIYTRMAVGEYTAIMFMPLVLYGMWGVYALPEDSKEHGRSWIPLTIGCTGIFLSHMLSTEMVALFVFLTAVILWKKTIRKKTLRVLFKSALSTALLSFWFLMPFLDYMMSGRYIINNNPSGYVPYSLEMKGVFPAQLFMNRYSVIGHSSNISEGAVADMPLTVGLASMLVLIGWFVLCCGKNRDKTEKREEYLAVFLSVLCLGMTLYFFPYTWIADKIPILRMAINSLQFPWRFLAIAGVLLAWLLCIILQKEWIEQRKRQILTGILIFIAFWQGISYMSDILNETRAMRIFQTSAFVDGGIGNGEYLPVEGDETYTIGGDLSVYADQLTYDEGVVSVSEWGRDQETVVVSLANYTDQTQQIEVPLINYKGYHAMTDNGDELQISSGTAHRISVFVPAGFSGTIRVGFSEPWYWRVSELISLITLLCLVLYPYIKNNVRKKQKADSIYEI